MTYAELVDLVQQYLENEETTFVDNIPTFVELAEEEICRAVQFAYLRKTTTALTFTGGSSQFSLPSDYMSSYSFAVVDGGTYYFLLSKDTNFMREAFPASGTTGRPRYFSQLSESTFLVGPTPDASYSTELQYYYKPTSIVTASSNWISSNCENALLFGTLYHGYIYMKGDQDVANMYKEKFAQAIEDLKVIEEGRKRKDTYRTSDRRMPT